MKRGPHEKPLCLGGTEERGQRVQQPIQRWPPAHTHMNKQPKGVEWWGLQIQSAVDKRLVSYIRADANMETYCVTVRPPGFI